MEHTNIKPSQLPAGFYWLFEKDSNPVVVEKREAEDFVRFTNGRIERSGQCVLKYVGPLAVPC